MRTLADVQLETAQYTYSLYPALWHYQMRKLKVHNILTIYKMYDNTSRYRTWTFTIYLLSATCVIRCRTLGCTKYLVSTACMIKLSGWSSWRIKIYLMSTCLPVWWHLQMYNLKVHDILTIYNKYDDTSRWRTWRWTIYLHKGYTHTWLLCGDCVVCSLNMHHIWRISI